MLGVAILRTALLSSPVILARDREHSIERIANVYFTREERLIRFKVRTQDFSGWPGTLIREPLALLVDFPVQPIEEEQTFVHRHFVLLTQQNAALSRADRA
jgi:hypothetical protein